MIGLLVLAGAALACDPAPLSVVDVLPWDGQGDVPQSSRLVVVLGDGWGNPDEVAITLTAEGEEVPTSRSTTSFLAGSTVNQRHLVSLVPAAPMASRVLHELRIEPPQSEAVSVAFTPSTREIVAVTDRPRIVPIEKAGPDPGDDMCAFGTEERYTMELGPAGADAWRLSLLHVHRLEGADEAIPEEPAWSFVVPPSGLPFETTLTFDADATSGDCFVAYQEDATGAVHRASAVACFDEETDSGDTGAEGEIGGCGCASGAVAATGWPLLLALGLYRRRR